jgi:hypothetical protein
MLRAIKGTVSDEEWDRVVLCAISVFVRELGDVKTAEKFVTRLAREESRVDAYIECGKLKSAYITAVKENLVRKEEFADRSTSNTNHVITSYLLWLYLNHEPFFFIG